MQSERFFWETETRKHQIFVDSRCSGQEKGHVETRAKYFQCCRPGYKALTKERFEALRKMVDTEAISERNSVRHVGTITCDKNEALELAHADFSLMEVSTTGTVFGSKWLYKPPCRRRLRLRATGTSLCEVLPGTEKSTGCETPLVVYVILEPLREQCVRVATDDHLPGQLHLQEESCEQFGENPDITTRVLESR